MFPLFPMFSSPVVQYSSPTPLSHGGDSVDSDFSLPQPGGGTPCFGGTPCGPRTPFLVGLGETPSLVLSSSSSRSPSFDFEFCGDWFNEDLSLPSSPSTIPTTPTTPPTPVTPDTPRLSSPSPPPPPPTPSSLVVELPVEALSSGRNHLPEGGSASLKRRRTQRGKKTWKELRTRASERFKEKLGVVEVERLRTSFQKLDQTKTGERRVADGMIKTLLDIDLSMLEVRELFGVGGYRVHKVKHSFGGEVHSHKPKHAFSKATTNLLIHAKESWLLEEGYPCPHRSHKQYFVDQCTWRSIYVQYQQVFAGRDELQKEAVLMAYSTFLQYVKFLWPNIRTARTKEDECDACVRLGIVIKYGKTEEEITEAKRQMDLHMNAARTQRRAVSQFTETYVRNLVPSTSLNPSPTTPIPSPTTPILRLPEFLDGVEPEDVDTSSLPSDKLVFLAEDFGQGIAMPHYGLSRPSCDYFNSNMIMQLYVQSDITRNVNYVTLYDERCMGKGGDALCSLRLAWHFLERKRWFEKGGPLPELFVGLYDNCYAQNKSNATFKFATYLSLAFYKKVLLIFYILGHSHMICDRVVAWCKRAIGKKNFYGPDGLMDSFDGIKDVSTKFVSHEDDGRPCWDGFLELWNKYFFDMPPLFTTYYVFEFYEGKVRIQPLVTSEESEAFIHVLCENPKETLKAINKDLWGAESFDDLTLSSIKLPKTETRTLKNKKLKSLSKKYATIPNIFLDYYPEIDESALDSDDEEEEPSQQTNKQIKRTRRPIAGTRPPGRPKNTTPVDHSQPSILNFLTKK
jgi:hypothetical protein